MKPNGIRLRNDTDSISLRVTQPSRVEDAIWDAVETAILSGWEPKRFMSEVREAWAHELEEEKKRHLEQFRRKP